MLTLSIPAAPRLRLTDLKESSSKGRVILPVKEWTFCFLVLLIPIMMHNCREPGAELFENVSYRPAALTGKGAVGPFSGFRHWANYSLEHGNASCSLRFRLSPPRWLLRLCWYP